MQIKEVNSRRATVIITDVNVEKVTYGASFRIEKYSDGVWEYVKDKNSNPCGTGTYFSIGIIVGDDNTGEMTYSWYDQCGEISAGKYRVSHKYGSSSDRIMYAEFEIQ